MTIEIGDNLKSVLLVAVLFLAIATMWKPRH